MDGKARTTLIKVRSLFFVCNHKTIKSECIRPKVALSVEEARNQIAEYIRYYNDESLHSAIGYITPKAKLEGRNTQIFTERDQKLEVSREVRKQKRLEMRLRPDSQQISTTAANFNSLTQQDNFSISI